MKQFRILMVILAVLLTVALIWGIWFGFTQYHATITIDTAQNHDLTSYLPFHDPGEWIFFDPWAQGYFNEKIMDLSGDYPALDGEVLSFPLYSMIVNGAYPETTALGDDLLRCSGAEEGFHRLLCGECDIYFGIQPTDKLLAQAKDQGVEITMTPVIYVPFRFFVHADNPVSELTAEQIQGIFSGEITNWNQVGGSDQPILIYQNEPGSAAQNALEVFMNGKTVLNPVTHWEIDFKNGFHEEVTPYQNKINAIGFILRRDSSGFFYENSDKINALSIPGSDVTMVPIYAITRADESNENVQQIIDYMVSPEGLYLAQTAGYYIDYSQLGNIDDGPTINTAPNIDLDEYMPFRQVTKIVRLEHEASLKLEDSFPRIDGAAAVFPVYSAFVDSVYPESTRLYNIEHRDMAFIPDYYWFNYSNTVRGYEFLARKETDIFFGGYPSDEQITYAAEQGTEFVYTPIGYEAFVFFVHKDNPIDNLTKEQIKGIYSGEITNWSQVGGMDEEIVAYQRNEGSGSQSRLIRFMDGTPLMEPPKHTMIDTMMGIAQNVANYQSATTSIGFSFRYYIETLVNNPDIKLLSIDGVAPTVENIQNGTYPEVSYLYAVSWEGNENENVQRLLDWVLSPEGQYIIEKTGYAPIGPTE